MKDGEDILDFEIKEGGNNLSSGEKQLVCIVRAILNNAKIVILDEATSNIDVVTEKLIQGLMMSEFKNSTMITVAHRLNTIINSDRIAVLGAGKCLEYGSPDELANKKGGEFASLLSEVKKS